MNTIELQGTTSEDRAAWLKSMLVRGLCNITFTKVNGEVRTMPCTLSEALLPAQPVHVTNTDNPVDFPAVKKQKKANPDVISAWCTDKNEWRSFRVMNVTQVEAPDAVHN